jgi:serine/threonine protein kinase
MLEKPSPPPDPDATVPPLESTFDARTIAERPDPRDLARSAPLDASFGDRYERRSLLGVGGMGEVHLCTDRIIGRDVAMKRLRDDVGTSPRALARFEREVLVQARLEHPSIVPVYDVTREGDRITSFTMKRIRGRSLEEIFEAMRCGDPKVFDAFSRRQLLTAFARVCLAVDYAHKHGVVHRDLKPGNVMLGEFGEVNVLDWGLAKLVRPGALTADEAPADGDQTLVGIVMGTPGYMAPEQARGASEEIDGRTDVYALGAILYEILTLERLHVAEHAIALMQSTIAGVDARPSARGHLVPPEMEQACVRATAVDRARRYQSARELADAVERYLDGDRDHERRRELAKEHLLAARGKLGEESRGERPRVEAIRHLGRAVALDPSNEDALDLLGNLVVEAPRVASPEAERELERSRHAARRAAAGTAARRYLLWCGFLPLAFMMGIREWPATIAIVSFMVIAALDALRLSRRPTVEIRHGLELLATSSIAIALMSSLCGPFVLVPGIAATNTMYFAMNAEKRHRPFVMLVGVIAVAAPFVLELLGVVPASLAFDARGFVLVERATHFPALWTTVSLLILSVSTVLVPAIMVGRMRDALAAAEQRLFLQAWHLRQMLPARARERVARDAHPSPS